MPEDSANDLLRQILDQIRTNRVAQLVNRVARLRFAIDHINELRRDAELHPLVVQGIVGHAGPAVRAEQRRGRQGGVAERTQPRPRYCQLNPSSRISVG